MAASFTKRYTRPNASNKEFVRKASGGWSQCIQGSPTDAACDVLANCVGYACGRFNEIYNEIIGTSGMRYSLLTCNAENFIERAKQAYPDLQFSKSPRPGAIICWAKGQAGISSDGAGHVAIVEEVIDENTIKTSESAYGGSAFYVSTRTNDNGRWGLNSNYTFRYFILNPAVEYTAIPTVARNKWKNQIEVKTTGLRMREEPNLSGRILGHIDPGLYDVIDVAEGDGYTWYSLTTNLWIADYDGPEDNEGCEFLPKAVWIKPQPVAEDTKVNQVYVGEVNLRIREDSNTNCDALSLCERNSYYNVFEVEQQSDYTWYKIGNQAWIAGVDNVFYYPFQEESSVTELKQQIKRLESQLNTEKELNESLKAENSTINKQLVEAKQEVISLNASIAALSEEKAIVDTKLKKIKEYHAMMADVLNS